MFVKLASIVRDKNTNETIMRIPENEPVIAEVTEYDETQSWNIALKTCVTGDHMLRGDCYTYQLLETGNWVKLGNGNKVMVTSVTDKGFGYMSNDGSEKRVSYTDKSGKLNFTPCATPKNWGETLNFGDFSHTYEKFSEQMHYYYSGYCNEKYIYKNFVQYAQKKLGLINLLRKHPNWNESEKAVIVKRKISMAPDVKEAALVLRGFMSNYRISPTNEMTAVALSDILYYFRNESYYIVSDDPSKPIVFSSCVIDRINKVLGKSIPYGTKATKIVRMILTQFCDLYLAKDFEKMYAQFSDLLSRSEKSIKFVVSANICDFVTMSHGNSWGSCHSFKSKGGWHCGCLSYANDYVTLIAYGVDANAPDKNIYDQPKLFRNLFMINEDQTEYFQSRLYPASKLFCSSSVNALFHDIISTCGVSIDVEPIQSDAGQYFTNKNSLQYPDYNRFGYRFGGNNTVIAVGGVVYHLATGKLLLASGCMSNSWVGYFKNDKKYSIITKRSKKALTQAEEVAA